MLLKEYMETLMKDLSKMMSSESVIGQPITIGQTTIIPVVTVSFGFGTGGGEGKDEKTQENMGAGAGAGAKVSPTAFLVINGEQVTLLPVEKRGTSVDRLIDMMPGLMDKINQKLGKPKEKTAPDEVCCQEITTDEDAEHE